MKFYLGNPSYSAKTEKTLGRITSEQDINPVQISHPHSQMPGVCPGGGMLKFRIDRRITSQSKQRGYVS